MGKIYRIIVMIVSSLRRIAWIYKWQTKKITEEKKSDELDEANPIHRRSSTRMYTTKLFEYYSI